MGSTVGDLPGGNSRYGNGGCLYNRGAVSAGAANTGPLASRGYKGTRTTPPGGSSSGGEDNGNSEITAAGVPEGRIAAVSSPHRLQGDQPQFSPIMHLNPHMVSLTPRGTCNLADFQA